MISLCRERWLVTLLDGSLVQWELNQALAPSQRCHPWNLRAVRLQPKISINLQGLALIVDAWLFNFGFFFIEMWAHRHSSRFVAFECGIWVWLRTQLALQWKWKEKRKVLIEFDSHVPTVLKIEFYCDIFHIIGYHQFSEFLRISYRKM